MIKKNICEKTNHVTIYCHGRYSSFASSFSFSFSNLLFMFAKIHVNFQKKLKCHNFFKNARRFQNLINFQKGAFLFIQRRWYTNIMPSTKKRQMTNCLPEKKAN